MRKALLVIALSIGWLSLVYPNPFRNIQQDYKKGVIDFNTAVRYKGYHLISPQKLPFKYYSGGTGDAIKSLTPHLLEIANNIHLFLPTEQQDINQILARPTYLPLERETDHFKIHAKDHHSRRGLLGMVARRRRLLNYLKRGNPERYQNLIQSLGIRR